MKSLLLAAVLGLAGCSPYWTKTGPALQHGRTFFYATEEALRRACGREDGGPNALRKDEMLFACTYRLEEAGLYFIHAGPHYNECAFRHEHEGHGKGYSHPESVAISPALDCGPETEGR